MEALTYPRRKNLESLIDQKFITEKWFGNKSFLKGFPNNSVDNSMKKQTLSVSLKEKKLKTLKEKFTLTTRKVKKAKERYELFAKYRKTLNFYHNKNVSSDEEMIIMNQASIKIQKVVKGFLARKAFAEVIFK